MKQIKLFIRSLYVISLFAIGFAVASCTNELWGGDDDVQVFKMKLNIGMQQFDGIGSRAASSFPDGASLLMRFDSEAYGTAVYNKTADNWNVSLKGSLKNTSSGSCDLYYSPNKKPSSTYTLSLDHSIPLYSAKGVYSYSESGPVITATLKPAVPRVCFKGTSGKKISLSGLSFYKSIDASKSDALSTGSSDISLTVNGSSTDYIYGFFAGSNRDLTLTVDGVSYTRTIESSMFANGQSGYIDIPTTSNLGKWKKVNTDVLVSKIELSETEVQLPYGESLYLTATVTPSNATNKSIEWKTDNSDVSVSSTGKVTGKYSTYQGIATITATAKDGSGKTASCKVYYTASRDNLGYVDLGLPSGRKWATKNVGANRPEQVGYYFSWGEVKHDKTTYLQDNYKYYDKTTEKYTKYVTMDTYGKVDNKTVLDSNDDAAYVNIGTFWRMPTQIEIDEMIANCERTWVNINGVRCEKFTSKINQHYIIVPNSGYCESGIKSSNFSYFWSSTLWEYPTNAYYYYIGLTSTRERYCGMPVRPVYKY